MPFAVAPPVEAEQRAGLLSRVSQVLDYAALVLDSFDRSSMDELVGSSFVMRDKVAAEMALMLYLVRRTAGLPPGTRNHVQRLDSPLH